MSRVSRPGAVVAARPAAARPAVREEHLEVDGAKLWVRTVGDPASGRAPFLVMAGGPGMPSGYVGSAEQLASPDQAVIRFDQRGTGRSQVDAVLPSKLTLDAQVADMEAVRERSGAAKLNLVGHSWGGLLCMAYAARHPDRVASLSLVGSVPPTFDGWRQAQDAMGRHMRQLTAQGVRAPGPGAPFGELLPFYFAKPAFKAPPELRDAGVDGEIFSASLSAVRGFDLREALGRLTAPVLVARGQRDPFGPAATRLTVDAFPNAEVRELAVPNAGHFWQENPRPFFDAVRQNAR
ncbi:MAG: alpha/beta hydrolase [Archangiaceae bacterium]|nr:alpha/beta hydrolase [Archangiaceae bacterium]